MITTARKARSILDNEEQICGREDNKCRGVQFTIKNYYAVLTAE